MVNKIMWAELSDVSNAASTTLNRTPETTTISRSDIAKIIKDAETAIGNERKIHYSLKDTFYSNAMNAVKGISQEKATPEQWPIRSIMNSRRSFLIFGSIESAG